MGQRFLLRPVCLVSPLFPLCVGLCCVFLNLKWREACSWGTRSRGVAVHSCSVTCTVGAHSWFTSAVYQLGLFTSWAPDRYNYSCGNLAQCPLLVIPFLVLLLSPSALFNLFVLCSDSALNPLFTCCLPALLPLRWDLLGRCSDVSAVLPISTLHCSHLSQLDSSVSQDWTLSACFESQSCSGFSTACPPRATFCPDSVLTAHSRQTIQ